MEDFDFAFLKVYEDHDEAERKAAEAAVATSNSIMSSSRLSMTSSHHSDVTKKSSFMSSLIGELPEAEKPAVKWSRSGYVGGSTKTEKRNVQKVNPPATTSTSVVKNDLSSALFSNRVSSSSSNKPAAPSLNEALMNLSVIEQRHENERLVENFELVGGMVSEHYPVPPPSP